MSDGVARYSDLAASIVKSRSAASAKFFELAVNDGMIPRQFHFGLRRNETSGLGHEPVPLAGLDDVDRRWLRHHRTRRQWERGQFVIWRRIVKRVDETPFHHSTLATNIHPGQC